MSFSLQKQTISFLATDISIVVPAGATVASVAGTVTIPANSTWEITRFYEQHSVASGIGVTMDLITTAEVGSGGEPYAELQTLGGATVNASEVLSNNGYPIGRTVGPFEEDTTLSINLSAEAQVFAGTTVTVHTVVLRLDQSYG